MIQAEPLDYDHDKHPVAVIEPSAFGYAFGVRVSPDFLGPIQEHYPGLSTLTFTMFALLLTICLLLILAWLNSRT